MDFGFRISGNIMNKSKTHILAFCALAGAALAQPSHSITAAMVDRWMTEISNWGRWGKQDQMGAANLITPAKRKQAASLVKDGVSVSLARNTETEKAADNGSPFVHTMTSTGKSPLEGACLHPGRIRCDVLGHSRIL